MVRIAHLSDTHLGHRQYNLEERELDIYEVMDEIADKILEERADIVIHSGDLFDSYRPPAQAYYCFKNFLQKLDGKTKIYCILGDHDTPKRRGMPPQRLFEDKIKILGLGEAEYKKEKINGQEVLIAGISNVTRRYSEFLIEELRKLDAVAQKYTASVLTIHQAIDKFLPFEGVFEVRLEDMPRNFSYYALGHLHSRIRASFGKGELAYAGSPDILRKDEIGSWQEKGKGFYIIDIEKEDISVSEVNLSKIRPQIKAKINYSNFKNELNQMINALENLPKQPILHVTIEGQKIDRQAVHDALSEALKGKVLQFRQEIIEETEEGPISLKTSSLNMPEIFREYLKDEKIANFALELFKLLRYDEMEDAKKLAQEYFRRFTENVA